MNIMIDIFYTLIGFLVGVGMIILGDLYFIQREEKLKYFLFSIVLEIFGGCIFGYFLFILLIVLVEKLKLLLGNLSNIVSYVVSSLLVIVVYLLLVLWLPSKIIKKTKK